MPDNKTDESIVSINSAALAGVRFLLSKRIQDLDSGALQLEEKTNELVGQRVQLRERLQESQKTWQHVLSRVNQHRLIDIDKQLQEVSVLRSSLAAMEERFKDLNARLNELRAEQEVLRSVYRSLNDLTVGTASMPPNLATGLRNKSRQVLQVIEQERMRIARDMHDGPAQAMANLVLQAEILERTLVADPQLVGKELNQFKDEVRDVLDDTRRLIFDLRPMTLDDLGLVPTLRKFLSDYAKASRLTTDLRVVGEEHRLSGTYEPTMFRIVQEALNNIRKHARAKQVEVIIDFSDSSVSATIKDDGIGFDVASTESRLEEEQHLGLISMRERVDLEKGSLQIRSQLGKGTEVRVTFDLSQNVA